MSNPTINSNQLPNTTIHPFGTMQDSSSNVSEFTEREPLITPPPTVWTKFNAKYKFGKLILLVAGIFGIIVVMLIVLGTLDVFHNNRYREEVGVTSVGTTQYEGKSSGSWSDGTKSGSGDGTYYGNIFKKNNNIVSQYLIFWARPWSWTNGMRYFLQGNGLCGCYGKFSFKWVCK